MTHYETNYAGLTPQAKYTKALADIIEYIGEDRFKLMNKAFHETYPYGVSLERFQLIVSFTGVQWYPARVWHDVVFPYG